MKSTAELFSRYQDIQSYVGWTAHDAELLRRAAPLVQPYFAALIEDFYAEVSRHAETRKVITGGAAQIDRLKQTLRNWLADLFSGNYNEEYVLRRWRVGHRHVEIGLDQVYTNAALSRLRGRLFEIIPQATSWSLAEQTRLQRVVGTLLDLDLAIIEDAYQSAYADRLQQVERLATIGQVAGGVAHELRNPLNVIKTSVYYLLHAPRATPEKIAEHLRRIDGQVGLADGVITALSSFSRLPHPEMQPVAVDACVLAALEANPLPRAVEVSVELPPQLPLVAGDFAQLCIVFGNLVRNARDAMPQGGKLFIRAALEPPYVKVSLRDTGVGIAPEHLGKIMEPLFSTKARGIGLGLAISRAILHKHGGELRVESVFGQGSEFFLHLRAAADNP